MNIDKLSKLIEKKYFLKSIAQDSLEEKLNSVKAKLKGEYNAYVLGRTPGDDRPESRESDTIISVLEKAKETYATGISQALADIVANMDTITIDKLFEKVNKLSGLISDMKKEPEKYRNSIHDKMPAFNDRERKVREHLKSKFETVLSSLSRTLFTQAKILRSFLPDPENNPLLGGEVDAKRKELDKQKLVNFSRTPAAVRYGLDSLAVMEKLLQDPESKSKLTTLINAIDRGHAPVDGPAVMHAVKDIMDNFRRKSTNKEVFEGTESGELALTRLHQDPANLEQQKMKQRMMDQFSEAARKKKIKENQDLLDQELSRKYETVVPAPHKKDDDTKIKIEDERPLLDKYNGLSFEQFMKRGGK